MQRDSHDLEHAVDLLAARDALWHAIADWSALLKRLRTTPVSAEALPGVPEMEGRMHALEASIAAIEVCRKA